MTRILEATLTAIIATLLIIIAAELAQSARNPVRAQPVVTSVQSATLAREWMLASVPAPLAAHGSVAEPIIGGRASWVRASLGSRYLAMRLPRGTLVRICGKACVLRVVNDYGPSAKIRPSRIADLSTVDFQTVCGPLSMGVCKVSATILESIDPPATDTAP